MTAFKSLWLAACATTALAAGVASAADDDWFKGRLFPPEIVLKNATALKLSDAQRKAIRAEIVKVQTAVAGIDADVLEEGLAIQDAIDKLPIDRADVLARADRVFAADARKKRAWIDMLINIKNALTPAQVETLKSLGSEPGKP
jgi:hypothetical protein